MNDRHYSNILFFIRFKNLQNLFCIVALTSQSAHFNRVRLTGKSKVRLEPKKKRVFQSLVKLGLC